MEPEIKLAYLKMTYGFLMLGLLAVLAAVIALGYEHMDHHNAVGHH
jgi:hypothetical protein